MQSENRDRRRRRCVGRTSTQMGAAGGLGPGSNSRSTPFELLAINRSRRDGPAVVTPDPKIRMILLVAGTQHITREERRSTIRWRRIRQLQEAKSTANDVRALIRDA